MKPAVLITGGSAGLGLALADELARGGFDVAICARGAERLREAESRLSGYGPVLALAGDVADGRFRQAFIQSAMARFGRIDALVNNASTLGETPLPAVVDLSAENLRLVLETNLVAPVEWIREVLPLMRRAERGLLVSISSDAAAGGYPGWAAYGASKAAGDLVIRTVAAEEGERGIVAYAVDPGDMATDMHRAAVPDETAPLADPADVARALRPLFEPLLAAGKTEWPFTTGARLVVRDGRLGRAGERI